MPPGRPVTHRRARPDPVSHDSSRRRGTATRSVIALCRARLRPSACPACCVQPTSSRELTPLSRQRQLRIRIVARSSPYMTDSTISWSKKSNSIALLVKALAARTPAAGTSPTSRCSCQPRHDTGPNPAPSSRWRLADPVVCVRQPWVTASALGLGPGPGRA